MGLGGGEGEVELDAGGRPELELAALVQLDEADALQGELGRVHVLDANHHLRTGEFLSNSASTCTNPPGQPQITHDKVMTNVCGILFEFIDLYSDSTYRLVMTVTTKFVVITTNFLL